VLCPICRTQKLPVRANQQRTRRAQRSCSLSEAPKSPGTHLRRYYALSGLRWLGSGACYAVNRYCGNADIRIALWTIVEATIP
jgi:hypothetical protein